MTAIDATRRAQTIAALEGETFDLAVVGGGITGAGVAREAALRGLRVALIEADDFAAGTSSRSSKLIHGGLRYLAMGDVALVRETALERKVLHRMAPHLAQRRWMVLPVRSRAGLLKFRTAIATYEKLGAVAAEDVHRNWDAAALAEQEPALDRVAFPYACAYREYLTDDARLVIANLRAAAAAGAVVLSHAPVTAVLVEPDGGRARGVRARCALDGRELEVRARCIVNAAGPWVEAIRRLEEERAPSLLHLSKGVHVCFPAARLPVRNLVLLSAADRRSLFAIPRGEVTFVGTTDTTHDGGAEWWPSVGDDDVRYLLEPLARYFPESSLRPGDVVAAWAGLRPLVARSGTAAGRPQELSRKDEISIGPAGIVTVAGGKLTGYRPMAMRILEAAAPLLGAPLPPRPADEPPLPGGDFAGDAAALAASLAARGIAAPAAERLVALYGGEALKVMSLGPAEIAAGAPFVRGEIDWAVRSEGAVRAEDVVVRRIRAALYEPARCAALVAPIVDRMAELLAWTPARRADEEHRLQRRVRSGGEKIQE